MGRISTAPLVIGSIKRTLRFYYTSWFLIITGTVNFALHYNAVPIATTFLLAIPVAIIATLLSFLLGIKWKIGFFNEFMVSSVADAMRKKLTPKVFIAATFSTMWPVLVYLMSRRFGIALGTANWDWLLDLFGSWIVFAALSSSFISLKFSEEE